MLSSSWMLQLQQQLLSLRNDGLYKEEFALSSPQRALIRIEGKELINFCSNNYLGLSYHPELLQSAKEKVYQLE